MTHRTTATICLTLWTLLLPVISVRQGFGQVVSPEGTAGVTVHVEATHPWVDSGLTVRKGDRLSFTADGTIQWGTKPDQVAGPEGHGAKPGKVGAGGLIGRVGYSGKPFPIGNTRTPIVMPSEWQAVPRHQRFHLLGQRGVVHGHDQVTVDTLFFSSRRQAMSSPHSNPLPVHSAHHF